MKKEHVDENESGTELTSVIWRAVKTHLDANGNLSLYRTIGALLYVAMKIACNAGLSFDEFGAFVKFAWETSVKLENTEMKPPKAS